MSTLSVTAHLRRLNSDEVDILTFFLVWTVFSAKLKEAAQNGIFPLLNLKTWLGPVLMSLYVVPSLNGNLNGHSNGNLNGYSKRKSK